MKTIVETNTGKLLFSTDNDNYICLENQSKIDIHLTEMFVSPFFDFQSNSYYEGATSEEIIEFNKMKVPQQLSRMKFEIQLYITTTVRDENNNIIQFGKTFQDIIDYIDSLQMSNFYKNLLKMRLLSCVTLERDNDDLNALAPGMGISQAQLDEIFINGNSLS